MASAQIGESICFVLQGRGRKWTVAVIKLLKRNDL